MTRSLLTLALSTLVLGTAACGGDDSGTGPDETPTPFETPTGAVYQLPAGIAVQGKIVGVGGDDGNGGGACAPEQSIGAAPGFVDVCLTLTNSTTSAITVTLPGELIFISKSSATQNGALVVAQTIVVPAGGTTLVTVSLHCVNAHRDPAGPADEYTIGPVSNHAGLREIVTLVQGKQLDAEGEMQVQLAVWEVSDEGGLTAETRQALRDLPAGSATAAVRAPRTALLSKRVLRG